MVNNFQFQYIFFFRNAIPFNLSRDTGRLPRHRHGVRRRRDLRHRHPHLHGGLQLVAHRLLLRLPARHRGVCPAAPDLIIQTRADPPERYSTRRLTYLSQDLPLAMGGGFTRHDISGDAPLPQCTLAQRAIQDSFNINAFPAFCKSTYSNFFSLTPYYLFESFL